jgi:hypothetical protein
VIIGPRWNRWAAAVCTLVVLLALSCSQYDSGGERTGSVRPVRSGLVGDVGPVLRSCDGFTVTTSDWRHRWSPRRATL